MPQTKPINFKDAQGRTRLSIGLDPDGSPRLLFFDQDGAAGFRLDLDRRGLGNLVVWTDGKPRGVEFLSD